MGLLAGSTGGALLAGHLGTGHALLIDGATFLLYALALTMVKAERTPTGTRETLPSALAGLHHIRQDRLLLAGISGLAMFVGCIVVINVADPAYVINILKGDAFTLGMIQSCWMVGIVAGNRLAARLTTDRQVIAWLGWTGIGMGAAVCLPAAFPHVAVSAAAWLIGGICNGVDNVTDKALVRMRTPEEMRGRVFAAVSSVVTAADLIGTAAAGLLLLTLNPRWVFALGGIGSLIAGAACVYMVRNAKSPAEAGLSER